MRNRRIHMMLQMVKMIHRQDSDKQPAKDTRLAVDHCHETGDVRGLLCAACNTALGLLKDDPDRIVKLLDYLTRWLSSTQAAA